MARPAKAPLEARPLLNMRWQVAPKGSEADFDGL
jgi:hypothetical protein